MQYVWLNKVCVVSYQAMNDMTIRFDKANITLLDTATIHLDGGDDDLKCKMERMKVRKTKLMELGIFFFRGPTRSDNHRPCSTSYQSSPSSAIHRVPHDFFNPSILRS